MKLTRRQRARARGLKREQWTAPNRLHSKSLGILPFDNPRSTLRDAHSARQQSRAYSQERRTAFRLYGGVWLDPTTYVLVQPNGGSLRGTFTPPHAWGQDWRFSTEIEKGTE